MTDNKKIILEEFESLKGQLVIAGDWKVKRLIAVVEDDMDYYWLFYDGRKFSLDSCLCRIVQLKGKIEDEDYNEFVRIAYLNHWDIVSYGKDDPHNFCKSHKEEITADLLKDQENKNYLLTEICWELNKID
jgi:hypothetical protein